MTDDREPLTFADAVALLADGDTIHVISEANPGLLLGADWSRADVLAWIREHGCERSGPEATKHGHGIACVDGGRRLFFETTRG